MTTTPNFPRESTPIGGRYRIVQPLGAGGFGQTFSAQDLHLPGHPLCVVKQLKPQVSSAEELQVARRLFDTEAQVLYKLGSHPQIPGLLAHFEEDQEFYLAQELIQGHSLTEELVGHPWTEAQVVAFLGDLLGVLAFVHSQGVIHRDIKPSNLIRRQGDQRMVLIDFGAVKQVSTQLHSQRSGLSHTISIGTQGYMPSEQIAGRPQFSSDLYAVGMLGIQALTGYAPTDLHPHPQSGELDWRGYAPQGHPALLDLLDHLVRYDFRARYGSAAQALAALRRLPPALSQYIPAEAVPVRSPSPQPAPYTQAGPTVAVAPGRPSSPTTAPYAPATYDPTAHSPDPRRSSRRSQSSTPVWLPIVAMAAIAAAAGVLGAFGWRVLNSAPIAAENDSPPVTESPVAEESEPETTLPPSADDDRVAAEPPTPAPAPAPEATESANAAPPTDPPPNDEGSADSPANAAPAPEQPPSSDDPATSAPLNAGAAQSTVVELYNHVSNQNWDAARAQFSPALAQQFDPGFFGQFDRVSVENLQIIRQTADMVEFLGENTYFYPDGTTQREARTFTVQTVDGQPRIVASSFGRVLKSR